MRAAKNDIADVSDGALDAALLVAARDRHGARFVAIVPGEAEQGRMEADRVAAPFQHRALEIVVQQDTRNALPRGEGGDVAAQEVLHPGVREEAQEDLARVAQHHDERHQRTPCPADLEMAEMSPVHLRLLAGQAAQPQIRFGLSGAAGGRQSGGGSDRGCRDSHARAPSHTAGWRSASGTSPASGG